MSKKRIAVVGGGPAALTTVYWLTGTKELREKYDITVYQMGWRLGGKAASGRGEHGRIEEHGLHVIGGFYQNFFRTMRGCYEELDRPRQHELSSWREAFLPYRFGVVQEQFDEEWFSFCFDLPRNDAVPGEGKALNSSGTYLSMLMRVAGEILLTWRPIYALDGLLYNSGREWYQDPPLGSARQGTPDLAVKVAKLMIKIAQRLAGPPMEWIERYAPAIVRVLNAAKRLLEPLFDTVSKMSVETRRIVTFADFALTLVIGILRDGVMLEGGYNKIDEYDYREWLERHGAYRETLDSIFVGFVYDAAFSFVQGDPDRGRIAAGAAIRASMRTLFTYKGAHYFKMTAGMGDVVFAPLYEVLSRRGVKFSFFHMVESLNLAADGATIDSIKIRRQAEIVKQTGKPPLFSPPDVNGYRPLFDCKGLPCWPAEPMWDQLKNGKKLQKAGIDFESYYEDWAGIGGPKSEVVLHRNEDFDEVLFAAPIGTVPYICKELVDTKRRWRDMARHVRSVETVSMQLWFRFSLPQLGWLRPSPLLSMFEPPLRTWADMSQTLHAEEWPPRLEPHNVSYFCGAFPGPEFAPNPFDPNNRGFPAEQLVKAREACAEFVDRSLGVLLPGAVNQRTPLDFDYGMLVDPDNRYGIERLDAQYMRVNCGPSERCTLALPGSTKYRMKAEDTGVENLTIAGDWIDNNMYVACVEGAVISGLLAARAISGVEFEIIGEGIDRL